MRKKKAETITKDKTALAKKKELEKKALGGDLGSIRIMLEEAAKNKDLKKIFEWSNILATYDDPVGYYLLGLCYRDGAGVRRSPKKAFENFETAADLSHVEAKFNLGKCYVEGIGVDPDLRTGLNLMEEAFHDLDKLLVENENLMKSINSINNGNDEGL